MNIDLVVSGKTYTWQVAEVIENVPGTLDPGYLSPHFRETEFTCNHCSSMDGNTVPNELLAALEDVRHRFGDVPVTINSGYRCRTHNQNVGSTEASQHRYPDNSGAADIVVSGIEPGAVYDYLNTKYAGKYGIGKYATFTHIDVRVNGPARW